MNYNLSNDVEYIDYNDDTWLDERRKGIGGSDVAAVLGESKYSSPLQVYKDKVEGIHKDVSDKVPVRKGKDLEAFVRTMHCIPYFKNIGYEVLHPQHIFINNKFPWIRANLDGLAIPCENEFGFREGPENNIVIEIKWVSKWAEDAWGDSMYDGVPVHYYMQVQTYMAVTGAKKAIVFALFDDAWEVKIFEVSRNEAIINRILKETKQFYNYHILMQIPPAAKASIDVEDVVEAVKLASTTATRVEDTELNVLIAEYLAHDASAKEHAKKATEFKDKIIAKHLEGYKPAENMFTVKLSTCSFTRFETTKFKEAHPELYAQFIAESEYTRFTVK